MTARRLALALLCTLPSILAGQAPRQVRGLVRDSTSDLPVVGAVVVAYGDERATVGRALTDESGRYRVVLSSPARSVRIMRIGFRPREVMLPGDAGPDVTLDVHLTFVPTLLERVQVVAQGSACPRRTDAAQTGGLLDQVRAALLATVVAREAEPAAVTRIGYERVLDANGEKIESQTVRGETADRATVSFSAVQTGVDFAERGFSVTESGRRQFFGPDADVLLDDGFARAYCFRIAERDTARPGLVGLGFSSATRRDGRVDIAGALWVDTLGRRLSHVAFRYVGLDELSEGFGAGGRVSFREVAPGIVLIDRWSLRLVGGLAGDALARADPAIPRTYVLAEIGGELAAASWPGGRRWTAPMGTLRVTGTTGRGEPAPGVPITLVGTDFVTVTDSAGRAEFRHLVPGPYTLAVADPRLAQIGLTVPTELAIVAVRDSTAAHTVVLPSAEEFVASVCRGAAGRVADESAWLIGRIGTAAGAPVADARWAISRSGEAGWVTVAEGGATGGSGIFSHCRNLKRGETVQVRAWRAREAPAVSVRVLSDRLTVLPIRLPTGVAARRGATPATLNGTVSDSATGRAVAGAFVELVGTNLSAITDTAGAFTIGAVPPGEYTAEIRTTTLDSLGAVGRSTFGFTGPSVPVKLFVPTVRELMAAMCGTRLPGTGVLLGNIRMPGGAALPPNVRVVAEWTDEPGDPGAASARVNWLRTRADAEGTYRLCGVPRGVVLTLRTQLDSGAAVAARPVSVPFDLAQSFAHVDVTLEAGLVVGAAFAGFVVADSTDEALAGAEVALPNLNRSTVTNQSGAFRINDIPPGVHRVTIRRGGFAPITADVAFTQNQTVDHRVVLGMAATALAVVQVTEAPGVNPEFDRNRKLGLGRFMTRDELDKHVGRKLGDVLATLPSLSSVMQGGGSHAWVVGKRMAPHITPRLGNIRAITPGPGAADQARAMQDCGVSAAKACTFTMDDLRDLGIYCPQAGEGSRGIICACYAQVWVDGRLMNRDRPTEPFDLNSIAPEQLEALEWYASASQTPAQYSSLNSPCGVMVLWTRRHH